MEMFHGYAGDGADDVQQEHGSAGGLHGCEVGSCSRGIADQGDVLLSRGSEGYRTDDVQQEHGSVRGLQGFEGGLSADV